MNLKKWKGIFMSKFVGTGPSSYEKRIYRAAVSQRLRNGDRRHPYINWIIIGKIILSAEQKAEALQETLGRKEAEFQALEERYKKYIEKAKSVINSLDPKQNSGSAEVAVLRNQLLEKHKIIDNLEVRYCVL